jgi:methyl-accepting chemotaxis protein
MTSLMGDITNAGKEQSAGIEQVNQAITQMDTVTQQNAQLVQHATSAAQSMQEQAASLAQLVNVFRLSQDAEFPGQRPVAAPAPRPTLSKNRRAIA